MESSLTRVVLTTDDPETKALGLQLGVEAPFDRPKSLSQDETPILPVLQHAIDELRADGEQAEAVVLLQPTSPLRRAVHIDQALELFFTSDCDSVVSVVRVPHRFSPESQLRLQESLLVSLSQEGKAVYRRQDKEVLFARNGPAVLVTRPSVLTSGSLYGDRVLGFEMPPEVSYDIDTEHDLQVVNCLLGS